MHDGAIVNQEPIGPHELARLKADTTEAWDRILETPALRRDVGTGVLLAIILRLIAQIEREWARA